MTNKEQAALLCVVVKDDRYWIVNHDPEMGPYDTKKDAVSDMEGVQRFYRDIAVEDTPEEIALEEMLR